MPLELIFTSVPKGVKPGSTGYCTVAKHKGIDRLLDQAIEKICYYELMNHPAKPVVCAYRIMRLNTGIFHVLTRTVYSGSDHTGRTNYLSHNLIFDQREAVSQSVSPADIFLAGSGWLDNWATGQAPMYLQDGICQISFPSGSASSQPLALWSEITGEGGLCREILSYPQWKFMTESGDHLKMLSLLSEFAQMDSECLLASWNQLTFVTYLQPSENPHDFKIIGGEALVPKFKSLSCSTLNLTNTTGPNYCFSDTGGDGSFGSLPVRKQAVIDSTEGELNPPKKSDQSPQVLSSESWPPFPPPAASRIPRPPSPHSSPPFNSIAGSGPKLPHQNLKGNAKNLDGVKFQNNRVLIVLLSLLGLGAIGASVFVFYNMMPPKLSSVTEEAFVQNLSEDNDTQDDVSVQSGPDELNHTVDEYTKLEKETENPQIKAFKSEIIQLVDLIKSDSNKSNDSLLAHINSLKDKIKLVESKFPALDELKEAKNLCDKLAKDLDSVSNALDTVHLTTIDLSSGAPLADFKILDGVEKTANLLETYVWDGNKTRRRLTDDLSFPEVFWVNEDSIYLTDDFNVSYNLLLSDFKRVSNKDYNYTSSSGIRIPKQPALWSNFYDNEIQNIEIEWIVALEKFQYVIVPLHPFNDWDDINSTVVNQVRSLEKSIVWLKDLFHKQTSGQGAEYIPAILQEKIPTFKWGDDNRTLPSRALEHAYSNLGTSKLLIKECFRTTLINGKTKYYMWSSKELLKKINFIKFISNSQDLLNEVIKKRKSLLNKKKPGRKKLNELEQKELLKLDLDMNRYTRDIESAKDFQRHLSLHSFRSTEYDEFRDRLLDSMHDFQKSGLDKLDNNDELKKVESYVQDLKSFINGKPLLPILVQKNKETLLTIISDKEE